MATLAIFTIVQDDGTTITLSADQAAAPFAGYHLMDYGPQLGALSVARNGSPYVDGSRIVNARSENVVEQYRLDIVGTTPDDAMLKLAALYQLVYWARDAQINPNVLIPPAIKYSIPGTTRTGFAYILNGSVSETTQTPRLQVEGNRIKGIILTLERTRWYLGGAGIAPTTTSVKSSALMGNWDAIGFDGSTIAAVVGDVPARVDLSFIYNGTTAIAPLSRLVVGYRSNQRHRGGYTDIATATSSILAEAENFTRLNFAAGASPNASPGGAGNTYVASTSTSGTLTGIISSTAGKYRVFARMQANAAWSINMDVLDAAGNIRMSFPAVTVSVGQWRMFDMGVISIPSLSNVFTNGAFSESATIRFNASGASGQIYVDVFILIPCDEYYLDLRTKIDISTAGAGVRYSNLVLPTAIGAYNAAGNTAMYAPLQASGELWLPPGKGTLFWLAGNTNFANTLGEKTLVNLSYAPQYETGPSS